MDVVTRMKELTERLKHGKHDQSSHGRRGKRGGGGGKMSASGGGSPVSGDNSEARADAINERNRLQKQLDEANFGEDRQRADTLNRRISSLNREIDMESDDYEPEPDIVDGQKLTKYDRGTIAANQELSKNGIKPSPNYQQTMDYARSAADDINASRLNVGSVYGSTLNTMEITPDGKLESRQYPTIGGISQSTHSKRQINRVVQALRETGRKAHYVNNDYVDAIVISGQYP